MTARACFTDKIEAGLVDKQAGYDLLRHLDAIEKKWVDRVNRFDAARQAAAIVGDEASIVAARKAELALAAERETAQKLATAAQEQLDAVRALVVERRRALVVQATGWGKSAVYWIAARAEALRMKEFRSAPPDRRYDVISEVSHRREKDWKARTGGRGKIERAGEFDEVDVSGKDVLVLARNSYVLKDQIEPQLRTLTKSVTDLRGHGQDEKHEHDLTGEDQRRKRGQLLANRGNLLKVCPSRLLLDRQVQIVV